jgi:PAS domain S-box-containing protein
VVCSDVTQLKQQEKETKNALEIIRQVIEASMFGMWLSDTKGTVVKVNRSLCEVLKVSEDKLVGVYNVFEDENLILQGVMDQVKSVFLQHKTVKFSIPWESEKVKNTIFHEPVSLHLEVYMFPILDESGSLKNVSCQWFDITDSMQAQKKINQQNKELLNLNAGKDRFVSILAHDLRGPFSSINGFLQLLNQNILQRDKADTKKQLEIVSKSVQHTYDLLEDILMWGRASAGRINFEPKPLNFESVCVDLVEAFRLLANDKGVEIGFTTGTDITLKTDKSMLSTVLRNLISNAIKFSYKGGSVTIDIESLDDYAVITVSDTGVGIEQNSLEKLFDVSQKISTQGTENEKGTGLGLLICSSFIGIMGGKIWAESIPGKGSDFKFTVPHAR